MSNAQKGGHARPLFTNVHAIDSFLAFPFMGIVEYVTLIKAITVNGIEMQFTEACIKIALSLIPYQSFQVHFKSPMHRRWDMHSHYSQMFMQSIHSLHFLSWGL